MGSMDGTSNAPDPGIAASSPATPATPAPPRGRRKVVSWIFLIVVLAGLAVVAVLAVRQSRQDPQGAAVGDCVQVTGDDADSAKKLPCTDPAANYTVAGKVDNQDQPFSPFTPECDQFPGADHVLWHGQSGQRGSILCLAPHQP
jgi:hypothetical protein